MNARRRAIVCGLFGAAGLALYLWPALEAPVVLWSDSHTDLAWAREGIGILQPAGAADHNAKPGYLAFLNAALFVGGGTARGVVVVQSILMFSAIVLSAILIARRRGLAIGIAFYLIAILFLRSRDAASAVMSETIAAAAFLLIVVVLLAPPRTTAGLALLGLGLGALFLVRPNVGGIAALLTVTSLLLDRQWRALLVAAAAASALVLPIWAATSGHTAHAPRGLAFQMFQASTDDFWLPAPNLPGSGTTLEQRRRIWKERTMSNWRAAVARGGADGRRQLVWRALHGLFGTEFYDARWSPLYATATAASRVLAPFVIVAAISLLLVIPAHGESLRIKALGLLLLTLVIAQDLVLGSLPRYVLPLLPGLLALGVCAASATRTAGLRKILGAGLICGVALAALRWQRSVLSWEWGELESSGTVLEQRIPRGSLPRETPATLHVRIAAPLLPTGAGLEVLVGGRLRHATANDTAGGEPALAIDLPADLLAENRRSAVALQLRSVGNYGAHDYLLFPVVPPPWSAPARRVGSLELSPATGLASGSLDWWAHSGAP